MKVLVIGAGNIAGRFDLARDPADLPLTHAGAYSRDPRFSISACVEPDDNKLSDFLNAWNVPGGYRTLSDLAAAEDRFDIISICSPTAHHASDLERVLELRPRLVFCEKPVTGSLADSEALVARCNAANTELAVNYTRRWDSNIVKFTADIEAGRWGELRTVNGIYNKGILNNGSHMVDLLELLAGPLDVIRVGKPLYDHFEDDPSIPVWLQGRLGLPINLACSHADDYALFELQFVFSKGIVTMEDGGLQWRERRVCNSRTFKGYRTLESGNWLAGSYPGSMLRAVDNIYHTVTDGAALASTGETALAAQRLCERIRRLAEATEEEDQSHGD